MTILSDVQSFIIFPTISAILSGNKKTVSTTVNVQTIYPMQATQMQIIATLLPYVHLYLHPHDPAWTSESL
jgi:hypothetical protein